MSHPVDEDLLAPITRAFPTAKVLSEGGHTYIYIPELKMPEGCEPSRVDALLCIQPRDGYNSRLFISSRLSGCPSRNWNGNIVLLDRQWYAVSWKTTQNLSYFEMLTVHLKAFRNG